MDSFVHCWDLRYPARPAITFCDWFAGATQVKWNRQDSHILASSHDRFLRIWDDRKGAYPLRSIEAHSTKIYGVDWNRTRPSGLITCSLDKTIKFWDYEAREDVPERIIRTPFPVWRARHTPFGWGLLAMPQRGNHDLHLYDRRLSDGTSRDAAIEPVHSFGGHQNQVKEFLWRSRGVIENGIDDREFQLVSWGTDRDLRLHRIEPEYLQAVGAQKGALARRNLNVTRQGAVYKTFRDQNTPFVPPKLSPKTIGDRAETDTKDLTVTKRLGSQSSTVDLSNPSFMTFSSGMQARHREKKGMNLITWMKGVKIGKREGSTAYLKQTSRTSVLSLETRAPPIWDMPESLGDEITHVGDKFKKVNFENVDVNARTATVSLNGPWGSEARQVYVKMTIKFPNNYPEAASPKFKLEKTSSIADETLSNLLSDIRAIAHGHQLRRKGSLEAVLAYILGERGLNESISSTADDEYPAFKGEESSSDEEDEVGPDFNGVPSQNLEISATDMMGSASANANVPLPRSCGATWAHDGRLICFFPPKEEAKSLLSGIAVRENDRSAKTPKVFEGFGRIYTDSPEPKKKRPSTEDYEDSESDGSYASTSSSDSGVDIDVLPDRFRPPAAWRGSSARFQRSRSADRSQQSSSAVQNSRSMTSKPKSVVSLRNFQALLPSKKVLAEEYRIFGDGPTICAHNSKIATRHGFLDLADIWTFVRLILMNQVPLEIMPQPHRAEEILILARRAVVRIKRRDSGLDLAFDEAEAVAKPKLKGRVKWGGHPFGYSWMIEAM